MAIDFLPQNDSCSDMSALESFAGVLAVELGSEGSSLAFQNALKELPTFASPGYIR
jgi:hypothetical protein